MLGWLIGLFSSSKKEQKVTPVLDTLTEVSDTEEDDDEPLEWSQSEDFVNDIYVDSEDEDEDEKAKNKQPRREKPVLSRIKSMLAPSLRKKLPQSSITETEGNDATQTMQPKVRRPKVKIKPPLPAQSTNSQLRKGRYGKGLRKKKKKKVSGKVMKRPNLSDEDLLASKEYEQALRLHLANAEPYPEVDDDDDEVYSDHYIESDSEYEYSYGDEEEPSKSFQSEDSSADNYFSFSWDADKQPSGVASKFSRKGSISLEEGEPSTAADMSMPPPSKKKSPPVDAVGRSDEGEMHFSFTWQHKGSAW